MTNDRLGLPAAQRLVQQHDLSSVICHFFPGLLLADKTGSIPAEKDYYTQTGPPTIGPAGR